MRLTFIVIMKRFHDSVEKSQARLTMFFGTKKPEDPVIDSQEDVCKESADQLSPHSKTCSSVEPSFSSPRAEPSFPSPRAESSFSSPCALGQSPSSSKASSVTRSGQRKFQESWRKDLPWITYNESTGVAICSICSLYPNLSDKTSKVVCGFTGPFKLETFKKHSISQQHLKCVAAHNAERNPECTALAKCIKKMDEKMFGHLKVVFNAAYYLAKNNKPFSDIKEILMLINKCGVDVLEEYINNNSCKEIISHISNVIEADLIEEIKQSAYISLLLDASTDKSNEEQLIVYARYLKDGSVQEVFFSMISLENGTAESYFNALKEVMTKAGLQSLLESENTSLIGIGTDGAAAMVGRENGLIVKLTNIKGLEHLLGIHCVAHKLNLAVLSSIKGVKYLSKINDVLKKLYKFYQHSPKRMKQLKQVAEVLECEISKFQYLHNVRWVASKVGALNALIRNYKSVVIHLEEVATGNGDDAATARGLLKDLKAFRFVKSIHFLLDFLKIFNTLSLLFQQKEIFLSLIELHATKAVVKLEELKTTCSEMENVVVTTTTLDGNFQGIQLTGIGTDIFHNDKVNIVENGIKFLKERFLDHVSNIANATSVFDTFQWPSGTELMTYGEESIKTLGTYYMKFLNSEGMKSDEEVMDSLMMEWLQLKMVGKDLNLENLLQKVTLMRDRFQFLSQLLSIVAVMPVSTASCERGFSLMNLIKNKFRNRMEVSSLHNLMMINLNGVSLEDFVPDKAIDKWYFKTRGVRHVHGHKRHKN